MSEPPPDDASRRAAAQVYFGLSLPRGRKDGDPHYDRHRHHVRAITLGAVPLALVVFLPALVWPVAWPEAALAAGAVVLFAPAIAFLLAVIALGLLSRRAALRGLPPPGSRWTGRLSPRVARVGVRALGALGLGLALAVAWIGHQGGRLTEPVPGRVPRVWLLHADNLDLPPVERWVHQVGFYRIARAATDRWGPGAAVIRQLTTDTLREALATGRLVFVASHGAGGEVPLDGAWVGCEELTWLAPGPRLEVVYFGACEAGQGAWAQRLAPARVIAQPRLVSVTEHVYWEWWTAPALVRAWEEEGTLPGQEGSGE